MILCFCDDSLRFIQNLFVQQTEQSVKMILCFWMILCILQKTFRTASRAKYQNDTLLLDDSLSFTKTIFVQQSEQSIKMILCFCDDSLNFIQTIFVEKSEQSVKMILCFCDDSLHFTKTILYSKPSKVSK